MALTRRRFAFWIGFGLFGLAEKLRVYGLDELAAALMTGAESPSSASAVAPLHWRAAANEAWRWYERESFIDGQWRLTGITTPINKSTGEPHVGRTGYLDESLVPPTVRGEATGRDAQEALAVAFAAGEYADRHPSPTRAERHGRPPSKWLRSLHADELRIWLKTIDVPEADVAGMTYWTHLTRDHSFDPARIEGLIEAEQAKLHAAAHFGY